MCGSGGIYKKTTMWIKNYLHIAVTNNIIIYTLGYNLLWQYELFLKPHELRFDTEVKV